MLANKITDYLQEYFPLEKQMDFDKCGLQVGDLNQDVKKVMIALNADLQTLNNAIDSGCQMLITHHPFLFETFDNYDLNTYQSKFLSTAIKNNIIVYSLHTCLDIGSNNVSMNYWLINQFDCHDVQNFGEENCGTKAILNKEYTVEEFITEIKKVLDLNHLKYSRTNIDKIKSFAILGGSGGEEINEVIWDVDCYITGDTKYHQGNIAINNNILLVDVSHHIEVIMEKKTKELLESLDVDIIINDSKDYFIYE